MPCARLQMLLPAWFRLPLQKRRRRPILCNRCGWLVCGPLVNQSWYHQTAPQIPTATSAWPCRPCWLWLLLLNVTCTTSAAAFRRRTRSPHSMSGPCVLAFGHSQRGGRLAVGWQLCKPFLSLCEFMVCNARFVLLLIRSVKCRFWPFYLGNTSKPKKPLLRVQVPSLPPLFPRK